MKSLEEIKIELTLKNLAGELCEEDIRNLPIEDELFEFVDSLGLRYGDMYRLTGYIRGIMPTLK